MSDPVEPPPVRGKFYTGARPSTRLKLLASRPHRILRTPPPQFAMIPKQLGMWGNDNYGDCVSAEEAFAKSAWSINCGLPEVFPTDKEVVSFAREHGFLDGADLTEVMDVMVKTGMSIGGTVYKDGGYTTVDYSDENILQSAISDGPVKIGIDHAALPDAAGTANGWHSLGGSHTYNDTDHCVGLAGYGPAGWLYEQLGVPLPSGIAPGTPGYLLFTWSTLGFVDHKWIMSTTTEAWLRMLTTPGQSPVTPPTPGPNPTPNPPAWSGTFSVVVDAANQIVTLTPPEGYTGEVDVEPPPYQP